MFDFKDIHTHNPDAFDAVINYDPVVDSFIMHPDKFYSVGIHPWHTSLVTDNDLVTLSSLAQSSNVVAIGEAGIDMLKGGDINSQISLFEYHVQLSESLYKPLIIHCVKAVDDIIRLRKKLSPLQIWIYHGFRGKPQLARQLIQHGFYLSFGKIYNNDSLSVAIDNNRAFYESD
ncbi:MAG: TatD family hydrolase [Muribaculaceae bacterium]|nr:TatD family hydrolase [Muribaculaceae bacterium]